MIFILDSTAKTLHSRLKRAKDNYIWGVLLGRRTAIDTIFHFVDLTKLLDISFASIDLNYNFLKHLNTSQVDDYEVIGYYYSSTIERVVLEIFDEFPFSSCYYVLRLAEFHWDTEWVDIDKRTQTPESIERGSLQEIENELRKLKVNHSAISKARLNVLTPTKFLTIFAFKVYYKLHKNKIGSIGSQVFLTQPPHELRGDDLSHQLDFHEKWNCQPPNSSKGINIFGQGNAKKIHNLPANQDNTLPVNLSIRSKILVTQNLVPVQHRNLEITSDSRQKAIQQFCDKRKITLLTHFTRLRNLPSILKNGLVPRSELLGYDSNTFNDPLRLDDFPQANCLSISFPNYRTFYRFRQNNSEPWVVICISASVLWELDCAFCNQNAASSQIRKIPLPERKTPDALKNLFSDFNANAKTIKRSQLNLPENYTTNPQAEVLVFGKIDPIYFQEIHYNNIIHPDSIKTILDEFKRDIRMQSSSAYFMRRHDYNFWSGSEEMIGDRIVYSEVLFDHDPVPF